MTIEAFVRGETSCLKLSTLAREGGSRLKPCMYDASDADVHCVAVVMFRVERLLITIEACVRLACDRSVLWIFLLRKANSRDKNQQIERTVGF